MTITERIDTIFVPNFKQYESHGDYNFWGFEAVINFCNEYKNTDNKLLFSLPEGFDTFLYYAPTDFKMALIDFSYINDNKIYLLNGVDYNNDLIDILTVDDFLSQYGNKIIRSVTHWKVYWKQFNIGWDN